MRSTIFENEIPSDDDVTEEKNTVEEKKEEKLSTEISVLKKQPNMHGKNFIPLSDGKSVAFIQGGYSDYAFPTAVHLWNIETNEQVKLNHTESKEDYAEINGLTLFADRYLIAAITPRMPPEPRYVGEPIKDRNNELLVWDLKDQTKTTPSFRCITDVPSNHSYHGIVVTEDHTLMVYYISSGGPKYWQVTIATFHLSSDGTLKTKDVFKLNDGSFHIALSQKGLIFEMAYPNQVIVRNSKGDILVTHHYHARQGKLCFAKEPFAEIADNMNYIEMIDHSTLSLSSGQHYIVDITNYDKPKQLGYIDLDLWNSHIVPMNLAKGVVALIQHDKGLISLCHLKENKLLGQYKVTDHNARVIGAMLHGNDLISSQYGYMSSGEIFNNISIQKIDLLQMIETSKIAEEHLRNQCSFPRVIANLTIDYLIGRHDRFFPTRKQAIENVRESTAKEIKLQP